MAARNILVGENKDCKISDFGLARDVNADIYVRTSQVLFDFMPPSSHFILSGPGGGQEDSTRADFDRLQLSIFPQTTHNFVTFSEIDLGIFVR